MRVNLLITCWALLLAGQDLRHRRLPNIGLLLGWLFGLGAYLLTGSLPLGHSLGSGGLALALGLVGFFPFYLGGWMGAGDVKLMAVIGWLGGIDVLLATFVFGSLLAGGLALGQRLLPRLFRQLLSAPGTAPRLATRLPYGACLALAMVGLVWLGTPASLAGIRP